MTESTTQLLDAALALSDERRLELAEAILASLDSAQRPPLSDSWRAEIQRRLADLQSGADVGVPWEEVKRVARGQFGG